MILNIKAYKLIFIRHSVLLYFDLIEGARLLETHGSMSAKSLPKSVLGMIVKW